jgi:hypothetical protein
MSDQTLRWLIGAAILLHGIAHVGAIGALWWLGSGRATNAGGWTAARSWVVPSLVGSRATYTAVTFWLVSLVGFSLTALAFLGIVLPVEVWRPLSVGAAIVSTTGIVMFLGTWPTFNTLAALAINVAVLVAAFVDWPSASVLAS